MNHLGKTPRLTPAKMAHCLEISRELLHEGASNTRIREHCFKHLGIAPSLPTISRFRKLLGAVPAQKFPVMTRPLEDPVFAASSALYQKVNALMNQCMSRRSMGCAG